MLHMPPCSVGLQTETCTGQTFQTRAGVLRCYEASQATPCAPCMHTRLPLRNRQCLHACAHAAPPCTDADDAHRGCGLPGEGGGRVTASAAALSGACSPRACMRMHWAARAPAHACLAGAAHACMRPPSPAPRSSSPSWAPSSHACLQFKGRPASEQWSLMPGKDTAGKQRAAVPPPNPSRTHMPGHP